MTTDEHGYTPPPAVPDGIAGVEGLVRCETTPREEAFALAHSLTKESFTYDEIYGRFCTVHEYIDAPPEDVYEFLTDYRSLNEYTYSTRDFRPTGTDGLYVGRDTLIDEETEIFMRIHGNREALTVDMHCAWDQGDELWMVYLYRIVPAPTVLDKRGSVVLWTNCHHPYYDKNPWPELATSPERPWVGDTWGLFYAGHRVELDNLKLIMEHRAGNAT